VSGTLSGVTVGSDLTSLTVTGALT
jgi:hypothetical protein